MVPEFGKIVALEGAFGDRIPNRFGLFLRYLIAGRSQVKNEVIRVGDVPAGDSGVDRKRIQVGVERGVSQIDGIGRRRFLVSGADHVEDLVDPMLVALQA